MEPSISLASVGSTDNQEDVETNTPPMQVNENPLVNEEVQNPNIQLVIHRNQPLNPPFARVEEGADLKEVAKDGLFYDNGFLDKHHLITMPVNEDTICVTCRKFEAFSQEQINSQAPIHLTIHEIGDNDLLRELDDVAIQEAINTENNGRTISGLVIIKVLSSVLDRLYWELKKKVKTEADMRRGYRTAIFSLQSLVFDPSFEALADERRAQLNHEFASWRSLLRSKLELIDNGIRQDEIKIAKKNTNHAWWWSTFTSIVVSIILFGLGIVIYWSLNRSSKKK